MRAGAAWCGYVCILVPDTRWLVRVSLRYGDSQDGPGCACCYTPTGGFDIAVPPWFLPLMAAWVERGGLLAVANLRGGGEYGRAWHEAGRRANKQNVFDDFCACAVWLATSGWSRRDRISIMGSSNGGLLVGACLTQHPQLFGACVPHVGVFDMLRFHDDRLGVDRRASAAPTTRTSISGCTGIRRCTTCGPGRATRQRCC